MLQEQHDAIVVRDDFYISSSDVHLRRGPSQLGEEKRDLLYLRQRDFHHRQIRDHQLHSRHVIKWLSAARRVLYHQ